MKCLRKFLYYWAVLSCYKFFAIDNDNVCTAPIMADKDILEFVQSSKKNNADFDDEKLVAPDPMSSKERNIMKSMLRYLDSHSNAKLAKNKMDGIELFFGKFMLKKTMQRKISYYFLKIQ